MKEFFEYLDYIDPLIGYDEGYEVYYSDVYGEPLHDVSYEDWLKYRSKKEGDSEG